jgi:glycosyltransferase involved in cell wall biosynthesis
MLLVLKCWKDRTPLAMQEIIAAQIESHGIADSTLTIDEEPEGILPEMFAAADITVSVCSSDGTPVSMLEAMASGSAVIVSDLPSLAEWVEDGVSGFLIGTSDAEQLAACLMRLSDDPSLRRKLGDQARKSIRLRADRTANFERVDAAYRRLAAQASPAWT